MLVRVKEVLETQESLAKDATDNVFLQACRPAIVHDIGGATLIHEPQCNKKLVAVHPRTTDTKNVWMFGQGHQGCLSLQK